ncbi:MAG: hypothetical protein AAGJ70_00500 [Pseudomonadota bacterium]
MQKTVGRSWTTRFLRKLAMAAVASSSLLAISHHKAQAQSQMLWQFDQYREDGTQREIASLTFGVPETDNTQVRATCAGTTPATAERSRIVFAADTGALKNGEKVRLQFSGGGRSLTVDGRVAGVGNTQERIAGVRLSPKHDGAIWNLMRGASGVDYFITGYRAAQLDLAEGREVIAEFLSACQTRAKALQASSTKTPSSTGTNDGISEKEAFDIAKELGTIGAWEAFLNNFGSGFRADLARAYLARLRGGDSTTTQVQPAQQPQQQGGGSSGGGNTAQPLFVNAGTSPWWNARRRTAYDGGRGEYTASVETSGVEMVARCHAYGSNRDLTVFLRDSQPQNGGARNRALRAAALAAPRLRINGAFDNVRQIGITFSDGSTVPGAATNGNDLQSQFFLYARGRAIKARSNMVGQMMSQNSMRITAPNLDLTFQLDGSRNAICSVLNRCGVRRSDCRGVRATQTSKPTTTNRCTGGRFYSRSRKACRCPSRRPVWNGVSCERGQTSCGKNFRLVNGTCVQRQNCGRNAFRNVEGDCFCRKGFVRRNGACVRRARAQKCTRGRVYSTSRNRCVCPANAKFWYGGRCRPVRDCPGDSDLINGICQKVPDGQDSPQQCGKGRTWVGGQGRCLCVDDRKRWNGKRCVWKKKRQNSGSQQLSPQQVKQATCNVLKLACAAGSNSSCRKVQQNGC